MTNEELVIKIKKGNKNYINDLWIQTEKLANLIITKFCVSKEKRLMKLGIEKADLQQEAFFALLQAIDYYKEDSEYKFNTYFTNCLKARLFDIAGLHTRIKEANIQVNTLSLDAPIMNDKDGNEADLSSMIPDPFAENEIFKIDEKDYSEKLHFDLQKAISKLDTSSAYVITEHYYKNRPLSSLANDLNKSKTRVRNIHKKALRKLRGCPTLSKYKFERLKRNLIAKNSLAPKNDTTRFKYSRTSLQERYVENLEKLEAEFDII